MSDNPPFIALEQIALYIEATEPKTVIEKSTLTEMICRCPQMIEWQTQRAIRFLAETTHTQVTITGTRIEFKKP
jgi:hypothetical protein